MYVCWREFVSVLVSVCVGVNVSMRMSMRVIASVHGEFEKYS